MILLINHKKTVIEIEWMKNLNILLGCFQVIKMKNILIPNN